MDTNRQNSILNFLASCNEFLGGKFLFANAKLNSMYDEIMQSPPLSELFEQCCEGFDYSLQSTISLVKTPTKTGYFTAPEELDKFLALTFSILKDIVTEKIDFNVFVSKYFSGDEKIPPTHKFAEQVILPFKNTVAKYFELDENNVTRHVLDVFVDEIQQKNEPETEEEEINIEPVFDEIQKIAENMVLIVKEDKKYKIEHKNDLLLILSEVISACKEKDIENAYSLVVALKYVTAKQKNISHLMAEFMFVVKRLENI